MCGIIGSTSKSIKRCNLNDISHRGPDQRKIFEDENVSIGHTRLSILDISENAIQPMQLQNSIIAFNGEIYNFKNLRERFNESIFKSNSDTEVLLRLYERYGIEETLSLIDGMFAFAIYDKVKKKIFIVRDRFGEKPLFYSIQKNQLHFASEISVLKNL